MIHNSGHMRPNLLMGQRFLVSRSVLAKIIAAAELKPTDTVLEVGPGLGALTFELAKKASRVVAVEKDGRFVEALRAKLAAEGIANVELVHGDILTLIEDRKQEPVSSVQDRSMSLAHCSLLTAHYKVVANIPYYLTGRLIRKFLESEHPPREMILMVQKEVAERITAKPPEMNLLALAVQAYGTAKILFRVSPEAFSLRPKVASALIRISSISEDFFKKNSLIPESFFRIVQSAFRGRRKTLENSLAQNLPAPKSEVALLLARHGLAGRRPQELSLGEWAKLTRELNAEAKGLFARSPSLSPPSG